MGRKRIYTAEEAYGRIVQKAKEYIQKNQKKRLYLSAKGNAKRNNVEFSLIEEDLVIPEYCPYLGVKLTNTSNQGRVQTNASIDRIEKEKGYIKENIQIVSDLANRMKQDATKEQLVAFAESILKMYKK